MFRRSTMMVALVMGMASFGAGCGADDPVFTVGGQKLTVKDSAYFQAPYFCNALSQQQVEIRFVEFKYGPTCMGEGDMGDGSANERRELKLTLGYGGHPNMRLPYAVGKVDCAIGPGEEAVASFLHYPAGARLPDSTTQADSGSVMLDFFDVTNAKPARGTFDLTFGADKVKGSFETFSCN